MRVLVCLALFVFASTLRADPAVALVDGAIVVSGLSDKTLTELADLELEAERWQQLLRLYVDRTGRRENQPAIIGTYRIVKGTVRFEPKYPLVRGVSYRCVLGEGGKREVVLSLPKPKTEPSTVITQVYPTRDRLPENQLKFYIHFSAPMSQGESYRHVQLLDAAGKAIELPFLELDQELWDPTGKRFTLFFDPGRIKRGLKPREDVGPALEQGKRYTLVIARGWQDAQGNPLKETFRKTFTVDAPDDTPPDTKTWKILVPRAETKTPLRITFPKSMDHALLQRMIWIEQAGKRVAGQITVNEHETGWAFAPDALWRKGATDLVVDTCLEDLAGNSIGRPFEVDILRPVERKVKAQTERVRLNIGE